MEPISLEKMVLNRNKTHPRIYIDEEVKKIPKCIPTGALGSGHKSDFDNLGIAINQYFKLLKHIV